MVLPELKGSVVGVGRGLRGGRGRGRAHTANPTQRPCTAPLRGSRNVSYSSVGGRGVGVASARPPTAVAPTSLANPPQKDVDGGSIKEAVPRAAQKTANAESDLLRRQALDRCRLDAAYTVNLQMIVLRDALLKFAKVADKLFGLSLLSCSVGCNMTELYFSIREACLERRLQWRLIHYLLQTRKINSFYQQFSEQRESCRVSVGELQKALSAKFTHVSLKDVDYSGRRDLQNVSQATEELLREVREQLEIPLSPAPPSNTPKETHLFLDSFLQTLKELLRISTTADKMSSELTSMEEIVLELNSFCCSREALDKSAGGVVKQPQGEETQAAQPPSK